MANKRFLILFSVLLSNLFYIFFSSPLSTALAIPIENESYRGFKLSPSDVPIRTKSGKLVGLYKASYALLIGVSNYTAGWRKLESVIKEIDEIEKILREKGFIVKKVIDPDSKKLKNSFENFVDEFGYEEDNRLLFFYSGHGHTRKEGTKGYLVPVDAPLPAKDDKGFFSKALGMKQIKTWAEKIESKHALFLFDSCFSGIILQTRAAVGELHPPDIVEYTSRHVRQFITAGSADELVPAESVFARMFIRALQGQGDADGDDYITGTELGSYLKKHVMAYKGNRQTPQIGKIDNPNLDEGDFVFPLNISRIETIKRHFEENNKLNKFNNSEIPIKEKIKMWQGFMDKYPNNNPWLMNAQKISSLLKKDLDHTESVASLSENRLIFPNSSDALKILEENIMENGTTVKDLKQANPELDENQQRLLEIESQYVLVVKNDQREEFEFPIEEKIKSLENFINKFPTNNPKLFDAKSRLASWEMHLNFRNIEKMVSNKLPLEEQIYKWEQFINKYKTLGDDPKMGKAQKEVATLKRKLNQTAKRDGILKIKSKIAHLEEKDKLDDSKISIPEKIRGWEDIKNSLKAYSDNDAYMGLTEKTEERLAHLNIDLDYSNTKQRISNTSSLGEQIKIWDRFIDENEIPGNNPKIEKARKEKSKITHKFRQIQKQRLAEIDSAYAALLEKDLLESLKYPINKKIMGWESFISKYSEDNPKLDEAKKRLGRMEMGFNFQKALEAKSRGDLPETQLNIWKEFIHEYEPSQNSFLGAQDKLNQGREEIARLEIKIEYSQLEKMENDQSISKIDQVNRFQMFNKKHQQFNPHLNAVESKIAGLQFYVDFDEAEKAESRGEPLKDQTRLWSEFIGKYYSRPKDESLITQAREKFARLINEMEYVRFEEVEEDISLTAKEKAGMWKEHLKKNREGNPRTKNISAKIMKWEAQIPLDDMVLIPKGEFLTEIDRMGNGMELIKRKIVLDKYFIDKYEVTQGDYIQVMGKNSSNTKGDSLPVESVTWYEAKEYCQKIGKRLPTEMEWDKATRGGSTSRYYWGNEIDDAYVIYADNADRHTHPVGSKKPNAYGLYDSLGNVLEWVEDWYGENHYMKRSSSNPKGPSDGKEKILRGGSWGNGEYSVGVNSRSWETPETQSKYYGFRCALTISEFN